MSFLAYAWRKSHQDDQRDDDAPARKLCVDEPRDAVPPHSPMALLAAISSSSSGEVMERNHDFIVISRPRPPYTPDGLKLRASWRTVQHELGIVDVVAPLPLRQVDGTAAAHEEESSLTPPPTVHSGASLSFALLPPRPSSSWNTAAASTMHSPQMSTNSFYADRYRHDDDDNNMTPPAPSSRGVAASPHLLPGQARTAVGALVANSFHADITTMTAANFSLSSPEWVLANSNNTMGPRFGGRLSYDDVPYHELEEDDVVMQNSRTPVVPRHGRPMPHEPPSPTESSIAASPSSLAARQQHRLFHGARDDALNTSTASSQMQLLRSPGPDDRGGNHEVYAPANPYDFAPLLPDGDNGEVGVMVATGTEVLVPGRHQDDDATNDVSAMSQSAALESVYDSARQGPTSLANRNNIANKSADDDDDVPNDGEESMVDDNDSFPALDDAIVRRKADYQRNQKESLLLAALERLQDDVMLVVEVEELQHTPENERTPLDAENFLTGYADERRDVVVQHLTTILHELISAAHEEFVLASPSEVKLLGLPHRDLQSSLLFCRQLVRMAVPLCERDAMASPSALHHHQYYHGKWKLLTGLRGLLGIVSSYEMLESPPPSRRRGGDTSVFSLPSESSSSDAATPMTSNVSMTTTIASQQRSFLGSRLDTKWRHNPNGLHLRRTIEILAALLQTLARAILPMLNMPVDRWTLGPDASIKLTEAIKRAYLALLAMSTTDLKALVDSFEFAMPLVMSATSTAPATAMNDDGLRIVPPPTYIPTNTLPALPPRCSHMDRTPLTNNNDVFSPPGTDDMRTANTWPTEAYRDDQRSGGSDEENHSVDDQQHCLVQCCAVTENADDGKRKTE